jgi:hypothetical protein
MLNFTLKGTYQDPTGYSWDYYGDDSNPSNFYIVPRPQFVFDDAFKPSFHITRYNTDGGDSGAGVFRFDIELSVPTSVEDEIRQQIPQKFPNAKAPYFFLSLDWVRNGQAWFDFASAGGTTAFTAPASSFGSNVASFLIPMAKEQLDTVVQNFSASGGAFEVEYRLAVPARLPAVTAQLSFDSSLAYQFQVTQPTYNSWGDETSPGSVQKLLKESAASKVTITWGTANPSSDLRQAVSDWANDTLADLVTAEVQKTIQLQGLSSGQSFSINEVSSFNSTYSENTVIDWIISPRAALPSLQSLGLDVDAFVSTVNKRQQTMAVSVFLPFQSDSKGINGVPTLTLGPDNEAQALVKEATVTLKYPGLTQSDATYTFTKNESHTFSAPYDEHAGPNWSLDYTVTYENTAMHPVSGIVGAIDQGSYTLEVEEAGILTVVFDASQAFTTEGTKPVEIDIAFSYIDNTGQGSPVTQEITVKATDALQQGKITSLQPLPINSRYNYQATYVFLGGVRYQAPLVQNQTGSQQVIPAANAIHPCNVVVFVKAESAADNPVFDATVQMWYQQSPNTPPGVGGLPTKESPAVFTISPDPDKAGNLFGRATFEGLLSGDQPLVYTASIDAASGQITIPETLIENTQPSIMVSPTQRYFTLEITPAAIDWKTATFTSVEVIVAMVVSGAAPAKPSSQPPERTFTWNKNENGSKYMTYGIQEGDLVTYDWKVNYITPGSVVQSKGGRGVQDPILNIPAA